MLAIISIFFIGLVVGIMMLLAASMLASHISSQEPDLIADKTALNHEEPDSPAGTYSP